MILAQLERMKSELSANPNITLKQWKVGTPASEKEIETFTNRISPHWKTIPASWLAVFQQANGIEIAWSHENGLTGKIDLKPLHEVNPYDHWFDYPQPMGQQKHFYLLDFYSAEMVAGIYVEPEHEKVRDTISIKYFKDEIGEEPGISLEEYLLKVMTAWGIDYDSRQYILEEDFLEEEYGIEAPDWPFETIEAYIQQTSKENRIQAELSEFPTHWLTVLRELQYKISGINDRFDAKEWIDLKANEVTKIQVYCKNCTKMDTQHFAQFPNLEIIHLDSLHPETDLSGLGNCQKLKELELGYSSFEPAIKQLNVVNFPQVILLYLNGKGKNGEWKFLENFPNLMELQLRGRLFAMGERIPGFRGKRQSYYR